MKPEHTALRMVGVLEGSPLSAALSARAGLFDMTQAAEDAVLRPVDTGRWSHALRAALAARIAHLNGETTLAEAYAAKAGGYAGLADPSQGSDAVDLAAVLRFMDKVAADTRNVTAKDVEALQRAGIVDADIVRLAELNAFLSYQIRLIAGLRLLKGADA